MDDETLKVVGKITHTYLYVLHDGVSIHRNGAAKLVAEELGVIDDNSHKEEIDLAQEKLLPFLDLLLETGYLLSRPQKEVMIAPKGVEALLDHEGTFPSEFVVQQFPQEFGL